jgi:hypothetical protein
MATGTDARGTQTDTASRVTGQAGLIRLQRELALRLDKGALLAHGLWLFLRH